MSENTSRVTCVQEIERAEHTAVSVCPAPPTHVRMCHLPTPNQPHPPGGTRGPDPSHMTTSQPVKSTPSADAVPRAHRHSLHVCRGYVGGEQWAGGASRVLPALGWLLGPNAATCHVSCLPCACSASFGAWWRERGCWSAPGHQSPLYGELQNHPQGAVKSEGDSARFAQKAYLGAVGRLGMEGAWEVQLEFQTTQITAGQKGE